MIMRATAENVVLLDQQLNPIGEAAKQDVHHENTPLHLACSCYVFNHHGELLITRRALTKQVWPGVWTNSLGGHPLPEEPLAAAVKRRAADELGLQLTKLTRIAADFSYYARDANGMVENEYSPIFAAQQDSELTICASEVMDYQWVKLDKLITAIDTLPFLFTPWMVKQLNTSAIVEALISSSCE